MKPARSVVVAAALALFVCAGTAAPDARESRRIIPYSAAGLEAAKAAKGVVVVETYADWCAPCRIQAPILAKLLREPRFSNVTVVRVGEDVPKSVWKKLDLIGFGTMIVYRGGIEVARGQPMTEADMRRLFTASAAAR